MQTLADIVRVWRGLPNEGGEFRGSAFLVAPTCALTAAHVVKEVAERPLYLFLGWNGGYFARVISQRTHNDRTHVDVALLILDEQSAAPVEALVRIGDPLPIAIGTPLVIAGFAHAHTAMERRPATVTSLEGIATAAIIQPLPARGMSGGPALSPDGFLRGITWARDVDKGRGYVTPFSAFRQFLATREVRNVARLPAVRGAETARAADVERLKLAQGLLLTWRQDYATRVGELTDAAAKARALQKNPPAAVSVDTAALINLAAEVVRDLGELPVRQLEFAKSNGLSVHETVFWGQALTDVASTNDLYGSGRPPELQAYEEELNSRGLKVPVPDAYAYEMLARVLESAAGLARFAPKTSRSATPRQEAQRPPAI